MRASLRTSWWALAPLLLVPLLLPVGRSSELGTLLGLIGGLVVAWQQRAAWPRMGSVQLFGVLLGCYLLAALVSLPGAVDPAKSWTTFAGLWRFVPFGLYACWALRRAGREQILYGVMALLVGLWAVDAWLQIFTGWSLGGPATATRITGVFGAGNLKLGPVLATLAPFLLWVVQRRFGRRGVIAGFLLLLGPIVLASERQAWLQFALVGLAVAWQLGPTWRQRAAWLGGGAALALLVIGVGWWQSPGFAQRMQRTTQIFAGTAQGTDHALSGRLYIWGTALRMVEDQPINGVGVRGFRSAYPRYARADDPFLGARSCGPEQGACHPHQWLLEVLASTGIIGLLAWLGGIGVALRVWWRSNPAARARAAPLSIALATSLFPLNTHLAFYSAWWGLLFWWLVMCWCGVLLRPEKVPHAAT